MVKESFQGQLGEQTFDQVMQIQQWSSNHSKAELIVSFLSQTVVG
ncbi:MAG: hypothetical protein AAFY78_22825 [Cyanobacteria bacterium J06648_16]